MERQTSHVEVLVPKSVHTPTVINTNEPAWRNSYTQIIGACIVHLLTVQTGVNMAFAAILVPRLKEPGSDLHIEEWEEPWIASLVAIAMPIGSLLSGPLMDRYGRRNVSLYLCIPYLISWILIFWAYDVVWLYVGRILAGAAGGISTVSIYYTSETVNHIWRPMLLGLNSVFVSIGILLTAIFAYWFHWRTIAVIFGGITALIFCLVTIVPESPHWLLSFGNGTQDLRRITEARKSIRWLNRDESKAEKEFNQLLIAYRTGTLASNVENETLKQRWEAFKRPEIYKPTILLLIIFFFQQTTGTYVIIFHAVYLFKKLGGNFGFLDEYGAMVAMGVLRFIMAIVSLLLSRRCGRRTLCIISGLGMGISMICTSVYMEVSQSDDKTLTLILVFLFICFCAVGWQSIPWTLTGELLPTRVRAFVGGVMISYTYFLMFVAVQTFFAFEKLVNIKGVFLTFGIMSCMSTAYLWKYLPETFGKTLVEIEQYFK